MRRICSIIIAGFILASCVTSGTGSITEKDQEANEKSAERRLNLSDARPDITAVVSALYSKTLHPGMNQGSTVFFAQEPAGNFNPPDKGFVLADVLIEKDEAGADGLPVRSISGVFRMNDNLGREDYRAFAAEYCVQDDGILILSSAMFPVFETYDRIRFFFVEKKQLPGLSHLASADITELLPVVAENAVKPEAIKNMHGMQDLFIFVFNMTKGSPDERISVYFDGTIADAAVNDSRTINRDGWRYCMLDGAFRLGKDADYSFFVCNEKTNAVYGSLRASGIQN